MYQFSWVMDIGEGMCFCECCEVCKPGNSQTCTPGDKNTLYVYKKFKNLIKKIHFKQGSLI